MIDEEAKPKGLIVPELSLVVLIGASGSGKSAFARKHFKATEVLSSDFCRGLVSDDETDQSATQDAFEVLHFIAARRLATGRLTVIDATNVQPEARKPLVALAKQYHCLPVAFVLQLPENICQQRTRSRADRQFGPHVVRQQCQQLRRSLRGLRREGFSHIYVLSSSEEVETAVIERQPLWNNRKQESGPFDIIGDVHGCCDELEALLRALGYEAAEVVADGPFAGAPVFRHPQARKAIFVGDLVDRGPRILDVVRLVANMVSAGHGLCVPGNHDLKLVRKLRGRDVKIAHGLEQTLAEIAALPDSVRGSASAAIADFLDSLVSHYVLDGGKLVVAHAGMKQEMQGRGSGKVRDFALYGETTGETDEFGLPVRHNWAAEYRGRAVVVYGHTPVPEPEWLNHTINIDTGCVFGGKLTALRYPEMELISVPAAKVHANRAHVWHMETLAELAHKASGPLALRPQRDGVLLATSWKAVDLTDPVGEDAGIRWWEELTDRGGEGMVVKPMDFIVQGRRGLIQPAVKCRGREYLRIIYGPEYTLPENLDRLRSRGLSAKRSLALREFALGIEGLERFVRREPLRRVHECCFGVLALESEPVDPRL